MRTARHLNQEDRLILTAALLTAGVKARIKTLRIGCRVVFEGDSAPVAEVLNELGFLAAGGARWTANTFQGPAGIRPLRRGVSRR